MFESTPASYGPEQLPGHTLVDVNGAKIGRIMGVGATYVDVGTGLLDLGTNLYVPFDEIAYCNDTNCYLKIPIDQVRQRQWHRLPDELPSTGDRTREGRPTAVRIPYGVGEPKQRQAGR